MAEPNFDQVWIQLKAFILILHELDEFANVDGVNYVAMEDTFIQAMHGKYMLGTGSPMETFRSNLGALLRDRKVTDRILIQMAAAISSPQKDIDGILIDLYDYMVTNSKDVKERAYAYGTPSALGGSKGLIYMLTEDENGENIENVWPTTSEFRCIKDDGSGTNSGAEEFSIRHQGDRGDKVTENHDGETGTLVALTPDSPDGGLTNGSFHLWNGGTAVAPTTITGWTAASDIANFGIDVSNFYRQSPSEKSAGLNSSLIIEANDTISQKISVSFGEIDKEIPYMLSAAWRRDVDACDGTLTLHLGAISEAIAMAAQAGWQILNIPFDKNLFYKAFKEDDMDIKIQLSGRTGGSMRVDDLIFAPMTQFNSLWAAARGATVPFQVDDTITQANSIASDSVIQKWFHLLYDFFLPHDGTPTISDP